MIYGAREFASSRGPSNPKGFVAPRTPYKPGSCSVDHLLRRDLFTKHHQKVIFLSVFGYSNPGPLSHRFGLGPDISRRCHSIPLFYRFPSVLLVFSLTGLIFCCRTDCLLFVPFSLHPKVGRRSACLFRSRALIRRVYYRRPDFLFS